MPRRDQRPNRGKGEDEHAEGGDDRDVADDEKAGERYRRHDKEKHQTGKDDRPLEPCQNPRQPRRGGASAHGRRPVTESGYILALTFPLRVGPLGMTANRSILSPWSLV